MLKINKQGTNNTGLEQSQECKQNLTTTTVPQSSFLNDISIQQQLSQSKKYKVARYQQNLNNEEMSDINSKNNNNESLGNRSQSIKSIKLSKNNQFFPHIQPNQSQDLTNIVLNIENRRSNIVKNKRIKEGSEFVKNTIKQWKQDISINIDNLDIKQFCNDGFATERKKRVLIEDVISNKSILFSDKKNQSVSKAMQIQDLKQNQSTMKLLQSVKIYNCFQDFQFPTSVAQIIEILRQRQKERPFKQIFKIMEPYIVEVAEIKDNESVHSPNKQSLEQSKSYQSGPKTMEKQHSVTNIKNENRSQSLTTNIQEQQPISKSVVLGQREQLKLLLGWFDQMMLDCANNKMDQLFVIAFTMGDLIQMSVLQCLQKGQLLMRMLKHFLNSSLKAIRKTAKEKNQNKDLQQQLKRKDLLIKDMETKLVKQKLKQKALMKEMSELKSDHTNLNIAYEMLERRLETEKQTSKKQHVQLLEKLYNKQEDQKNVLIEKVNDMFAIKQAQITEPLTMEQTMKKKEKYYVKKFGRKDDITLEIIHKHQYIIDEQQKQKQALQGNTTDQETTNKKSQQDEFQRELDLTELPPSFVSRRTQTETQTKDVCCGLESGNDFNVSMGIQVQEEPKYCYDIAIDAIQEFKATVNQEIQVDLTINGLYEINKGHPQQYHTMPLDGQLNTNKLGDFNTADNEIMLSFNDKMGAKSKNLISNDQEISSTDRSKSQISQRLGIENKNKIKLKNVEYGLKSMDLYTSKSINNNKGLQNFDHLSLQVGDSKKGISSRLKINVINKQKRNSISSSRQSNAGEKPRNSNMGLIQKLLNKINKEDTNNRTGETLSQFQSKRRSVDNIQQTQSSKERHGGSSQQNQTNTLQNTNSGNKSRVKYSKERIADVLDNSPSNQQNKLVHTLALKHQHEQEKLNKQKQGQFEDDVIQSNDFSKFGEQRLQNSNTLNLSNIIQDQKDESVINQQILDQFNFKIKKLNNPLLNALLDSADLEKLFKVLSRAQQTNKTNNPTNYTDKNPLSDLNGDQTYDYQKFPTKSIDGENDYSVNQLDDTQIFQTEVPKILIRQAQIFKQKISNLDKDEYGDFVIKPWDGDDHQSQEVVKQGRKLIGWIDKIREDTEIKQQQAKNGVTIGLQTDSMLMQSSPLKPVITITNIEQQHTLKLSPRHYDKIQIKGEQIYSKHKYSQLNQSRDIIQQNDKTQNNISYVVNKKQSISPTKARFNYSPLKKGENDSQSQINQTNQNISKFQFLEFNLGIAQYKVKPHPMTILMDKYWLAQENKDLKFMAGINVLSMRLLIKLMNQYLCEKGLASIDNNIARNQHISEFIYDQNFHKFGIVKLTEKKIKELVLTIQSNKHKFLKCEFYARLMDINSNRDLFYSNDDLSFLYKIDKTLTQINGYKDSKRQPRMIYNFDSSQVHCHSVIEMIQILFQTIVDEYIMNQWIDRIRDMIVTSYNIKPINKSALNFEEYSLASELVYNIMISFYQEIKLKALSNCIRQGLIENVDGLNQQYKHHIYYEKCINYEQMCEMLRKANNRVNINRDQTQAIFDKNKIQVYLNDETMVNAQNRASFERITIEKVLSVMLKLNIIQL